jgi:hypothetical protein
VTGITITAGIKPMASITLTPNDRSGGGGAAMVAAAPLPSGGGGCGGDDI